MTDPIDTVAGNTTAGDPLTILVCDDDEVMVDVACQLLMRRGFNVLTADSGEQALRLCDSNKPDLMLLDASMPSMDGFDVCLQLRRGLQQSRLPIIMVTSLDDQQSVDRAYEAGANEYITKPINWAVLEHRIRTLIKQQQDEEVIHLFTRHSPVAIAMFDQDMRYLHVSERWEEDYHLVNRNIIGRSHYELLPDQPEKWQAIHQRCLKGSHEKSDADPIQVTDHEVRWFRWEGLPWHKPTGAVGGILMFTEDITQHKKMEDELRRHRDKLAFERQIIEEIITRMRSSKLFNGRHLRFLQDPVEKTAGDVLLSAFSPDGAQHVLLGDFTGHGLPAAIGGPIVSDIFYSMTSKGWPMAKIITEVNVRLYEKTPTNVFLAAGFLELDPSRTQLLVWNCAIPDMLLFRHNRLDQRVVSGHMARGLVNRPCGPGVMIQVEPGDRFFAYTDGLTEESNADGEMFGQDNFERLLQQILDLDEPLEMIQRTLRGYRAGHEQSDDMTMVELTC
ncbi:MAG: SpoIIE family protein phosphatase [Magnetococcales bacterium]|nr:SpoIIE family protein phosphatase [Magnetococcales bacterium]